MNIYLYISKKFDYSGKIIEVLKDFSSAKIYFNKKSDGLIKILNDLNISANIVPNDQIFNVLRDLNYILIFYDETDKKAKELCYYAVKRSKNLILISKEDRFY